MLHKVNNTLPLRANFLGPQRNFNCNSLSLTYLWPGTLFIFFFFAAACLIKNAKQSFTPFFSCNCQRPLPTRPNPYLSQLPLCCGSPGLRSWQRVRAAKPNRLNGPQLKWFVLSEWALAKSQPVKTKWPTAGTSHAHDASLQAGS